MIFPGGRRFAFSILDDTDDATLENIEPVYRRLKDLGLRTTKTVWAFDCPEGSDLFFAAETLEDPAYREFVRGLARDGFEVAFHGATMESSRRERTIGALERLRREFGGYPRLFCNHGHNRENLYWGAARFRTGLFRSAARVLRGEPRHHFAGEREGSEYFWGDVCRQHIAYVRNFTFRSLDMLRVTPMMPYSLASTGYVNRWFSTADAPDVEAFNRLVSREAIEALEEHGGVCIVSTHLGKGFARNGSLNAGTDAILSHLASRPGWFVPVSRILDHLLEQQDGAPALTYLQTLRLEARFLLDRARGLAQRGAGGLLRT